MYVFANPEDSYPFEIGDKARVAKEYLFYDCPSGSSREKSAQRVLDREIAYLKDNHNFKTEDDYERAAFISLFDNWSIQTGPATVDSFSSWVQTVEEYRDCLLELKQENLEQEIDPDDEEGIAEQLRIDKVYEKEIAQFDNLVIEAQEFYNK